MTYLQQQPGEVLPGGPLHRRGVTGTSFTTDFSVTGHERTQQNQVFSGQKENILDEERRLIEKVFAIVDKDNSGTIDTEELEGMFRLFSIDTHFLQTAKQRIMANVDKDHDGTISPLEFYKLLSQKFEKGDPRSEVQNVFERMDKKHDGQLDVDELFEVSTMLGEGMSKQQIKEMIMNFKILAADVAKKGQTSRRNSMQGAFQGTGDLMDQKLPSTTKEILALANPTMNMDEFYAVMQVEL
jgi:Ca2+-binding EF-hand superfamily protein